MGPLLLTRTESLPLYCSRGALWEGSQGDAFLLPWSGDLHCAFPPIPFLLQLLCKIHWNRATIIALFCSHRFWFTEFLRFSARTRLHLHILLNLLTQDWGREGPSSQYRPSSPLQPGIWMGVEGRPCILYPPLTHPCPEQEIIHQRLLSS